MSKLKELDFTLQYLYQKNEMNSLDGNEWKDLEGFIFSKQNPNWVTVMVGETDRSKFLPQLEKLVDDGYAKFHSQVFVITTNGMLFYEKTIWPYIHSPYRCKNYKENWQTAWNIGKTIVIIFNAGLLLYFAYLQAIHH